MAKNMNQTAVMAPAAGSSVLSGGGPATVSRNSAFKSLITFSIPEPVSPAAPGHLASVDRRFD